MCGKILADLGMNVIKIEQPGGDSSRIKGPFYGNNPDPESSLCWFAYNQGKKGITLNLESPEGRGIFFSLVEKSNIVIESYPPGWMERKGLGYQNLCQSNPAIVLTRISPFGQDGPYADYKAPDIVLMAMGGLMNLCGDADRPPVRISHPQAYLYASADAAIGSITALYYQQASGRGQVVDVSALESVEVGTFNARPWWEIGGNIISRQGARRGGLASGVIQRQTWPCKNGFVTYVVTGGVTGAKWNKALTKWMDEEGHSDDFIQGIDWDYFDMGAATQEFHDKLEEKVCHFFLKHTERELYEGSLKRNIGLYPVADVSFHGGDPQLEARNFWVTVKYPELGISLNHPGSFAQTSSSMKTGGRAPRIGEHNQEIYGALGMSVATIKHHQRNGII